MAEILHAVEMRASPADIFRALTTETGPDAWWSADSIRMRVVAAEDGTRVSWRCTDGPPDWIGTEIAFDLAPSGRETVVHLAHRGWRGPSLFLARCATKWARFLLALKRFVETPEPTDLRV